MMEPDYYHRPARPRGRLEKMFVALAGLSAAAAFVFIGIHTISATGESDGDTVAGGQIKFYDYAGGIAAGGYDVVAYFSEARAIKGKSAHFAKWGGEEWRFASPENRKAFLENPARYIPQYGGHCAYGVANGYLVRGDPHAWSVHNGKLYLNYNKNIRLAWLANAAGFLQKSEPNWKKLNL